MLGGGALRGGSGYGQLRALGFQDPLAHFRATLDYDFRAMDALRVGIGIGFERGGDTRDVAFPEFDSFETASTFDNGNLNLSIIPGGRIALRGSKALELGLRLRGGIGFINWSYGRGSDLALSYRAEAALDAAMVFRKGFGLGLQSGYRQRWSGSFGRNELVFYDGDFFLSLGLVVET